MIKITRFLACFFACICLARTAWGWGQEGHMVVAQIAYNHLSPAVKAQCDALIAVQLQYASTASTNFITAASWADDFKSQLGTGTSHYIDLPLCINGLAVNNIGTCTGTCTDGVCTNNAPPEVPNIVTALNQYIATLQNPYAALTDRATAFRYVLHFTGDSTQPLHCSNGISTNHPPSSGGDGGGNEFTIHGTWSSLHPLWDAGGGYLNDSGVSRPMQASGYAIISNKAADVEATYPYTPSIGTIPDPMTWATGTYYYAQTVAYVGITEGGTPTTSYLNSASSCSKQRMAVGGKRLADLLMTIIVTNAASFTASTTSGVAPLPVIFTDASTGSITNWFWNFGDGKTTNFTASTNPTHTYAAGTYNVTLIVNGYGGLSTNIQANYIIAAACTPPTASVSGDQTICPAGSATIQASLTGTGSWNLTWLDGASGTNYVQNGVAASPATRTVSPSSSTTYTVTAVSDASGCSGGTSSGSATVTVDVPATPTAGNNGPICSGSELDLSTPTVTGATYSWTGPSFTSTQQNPSIANATTAASGTYSVTITDSNGCTSAAGSTTATVNAIPATPTASNNGPICSGGTLVLSTPTVLGATYGWTGPNGFASAQQNPSIPGATTAASGTYSVTITSSSGCTSPAGSTTATVNPLPAAPTAGNNGPILAGNTLNLTASSVSDATYNWTGPNGFTSTDQNPSIPNATSAAGGTYTVTVTDLNGCTSAAASTTALIMAPRITSITRQGSDIVITWATIGGTTNRVQATPGDPDYNTNFDNISDPLFITGSGDTSTNYTDPGAVTNLPAKFYRVWLVP